jgi:hypothetical protein
MKNQVIKPFATALWLINNTKLTFAQIARFCDISETEIQAMADGFEKSSLEPHNPLKVGQLTIEEIARCEESPLSDLKLSYLPIFPDTEIKVSKKVYTPMSKRKDKLNGALFLIQNYPELPEIAVVKLTGVSKKTAEALFNNTYAKIEDIIPRDPISLGLCTQVKLNDEMAKYKKSDRD